MYPITFPNLNLIFNINPVAFNLFGKDIFWYGVLITLGAMLAIFLAKKDDGLYGLKWDDVLEYLCYAIVIGIFCARIYYVVFSFSYYKDHLLEIFMIWNGGLAIYGGIIGALLVGIVYCNKKKINFLSLFDYLAPYLPLVQSIGRWGNFINREAYGSITDCFFKMGIFDLNTEGYIYVHPTFLYESICTFLLFLILYSCRKKKKFDGEIFYSYMMLYGIIRAMIEGFRVDSLYLYNFRVSQILAIIFAIFFGILLVKNKLKNKIKKDIDK